MRVKLGKGIQRIYEQVKWNERTNHQTTWTLSNVQIHALLKDKDCGHVDIAQWSVLFEDIKRFDELKSRVMSLSKVRAWQYYLWHICALFCCVEASLVSVWSGQTCKETLRCIQCPLTEMVSSLIILVSLRGNCSGKKESLADQFGLHCSITQIRGNRPELGRLSVISSSSSLHWYILCSLNMPALTQTISIIAAKWLYPPQIWQEDCQTSSNVIATKGRKDCCWNLEIIMLGKWN